MVAEKWTIWDSFFRWLSRWLVRRKILEEWVDLYHEESKLAEKLEVDRDRWRRAAELLAAGWTEESNKYFVMKYADGALLKWAKDKACKAAAEATKEAE